MRWMVAILTIAVALAFAPFVQAGKLKGTGDKAKAEGHGLHATVVSVDGSTLTVSVTNKKKGTNKDRKIDTNDQTKVLIDGKQAKLEDLKAGEKVTIRLANHIATQIAANTHETGNEKGTASSGTGTPAK